MPPKKSIDKEDIEREGHDEDNGVEQYSSGSDNECNHFRPNPPTNRRLFPSSSQDHYPKQESAQFTNNPSDAGLGHYGSTVNQSIAPNNLEHWRQGLAQHPIGPSSSAQLQGNPSASFAPTLNTPWYPPVQGQQLTNNNITPGTPYSRFGYHGYFHLAPPQIPSNQGEFNAPYTGRSMENQVEESQWEGHHEGQEAALYNGEHEETDFNAGVYQGFYSATGYQGFYNADGHEEHYNAEGHEYHDAGGYQEQYKKEYQGDDEEGHSEEEEQIQTPSPRKHLERPSKRNANSKARQNATKKKHKPVADRATRFKVKDNLHITMNSFKINEPVPTELKFKDAEGEVYNYAYPHPRKINFGSREDIQKLNAWGNQVIRRNLIKKNQPDHVNLNHVKRPRKPEPAWSYEEKDFVEEKILESMAATQRRPTREDWLEIARALNGHFRGHTLDVDHPLVPNPNPSTQAGVVEELFNPEPRNILPRTGAAVRKAATKWPSTRQMMDDKASHFENDEEEQEQLFGEENDEDQKLGVRVKDEEEEDGDGEYYPSDGDDEPASIGPKPKDKDDDSPGGRWQSLPEQTYRQQVREKLGNRWVRGG